MANSQVLTYLKKIEMLKDFEETLKDFSMWQLTSDVSSVRVAGG